MLVKTLQVPYFYQSELSSCGAAALAMIYGFYGFLRTEKEIWEKRKLPRQLESGFYIQTKSLIEDAIDCNFEEIHGKMPLDNQTLLKNNLLEIIKNEIPILVCKQRKNPILGHFVVIIGINESNIIFHDPEDGKKRKIKIKKFINEWKATGSEVTGGVFILFFPKEKMIY
jgi:ABC-type bacteriocin/lantibiotic exporter with double-glycine peptidase domain